MRDGARRHLAPALLCLLVPLLLAACGGGEADTGVEEPVDTAALEREAERDADIAIVNQIIGRQRAAVAAFDRAIPAMRGRTRALAIRIRTQEEEHTVALLEALRALEGFEEARPEEIDSGPLKSERERLAFLYEVESATIADEISAIASLESATTRSLLASTVANQSQHLVLLRRALGAPPAKWVPAPFENGTTPVP